MDFLFELLSKNETVGYLLKGGMLMYPLFICSVLSIAIIINRIWFYYYAHINEEHLMDRIKQFLDQNMVEEAIALCDSTQGPVAYILKAGLINHTQGQIAIEKAFEEAELEAIPLLEKYLPVLGTIASISTLLGFTGTVLGMIKAFNSIAASGTSSPTIVASGIAEALITTATGLLIAIPTVVFYHYFSNRVHLFTLEMEKRSKKLIGLLYKYKQGRENETK